jgi:hypothetical protein
MNNLMKHLMIETAWDMAKDGGHVVVIHPRGCGKNQFQETFKAYFDQKKRIQAQKNYLELAGKPKPFNVRMRRQRVKA